MASSDPVRTLVQPVEHAARRVAPWIARLARTGYFAKAVLYAAVGILAAQAALGEGGRTTDMNGALREVLRAPVGNLLLFICSVGLAAYALWRTVDALVDVEGHGRSFRGIADRLGSALSGVTHGLLALTAFHLAAGAGDGGGTSSHRLAAHLFNLPGGQWLAWLVALGLLADGVIQIINGCAAKLDRPLNLAALPQRVARYVIHVSRVGIGARGVVFAVIGILLLRAVVRRDPGRAGGMRESLELLGQTGHWLLVFAALGLVAYAFYQLLNARYRRIP
jgi:hypothetical protein